MLQFPESYESQTISVQLVGIERVDAGEILSWSDIGRKGQSGEGLYGDNVPQFVIDCDHIAIKNILF